MSRISSTVRSRYASSGPRAVTATSVPQQSQTVASTSTASATCEATLIVAARSEVMPAPPSPSCPACSPPAVLHPSIPASPTLLPTACQNETMPCSPPLPSLCARTGTLLRCTYPVQCYTLLSHDYSTPSIPPFFNPSAPLVTAAVTS